MSTIRSSKSLLADARRRRLVPLLSEWYRANRRDLPWRRTSDPYAIWISEAMLQQTRVEAVVDYWLRFLERFPDVGALQRAPIEEVLAAWSGLGYYRRARALHAAARRIVEEHGGVFPREREAALALPGVGPYTAGAVLSIAYDLPEPLVDGNVERVFARLFGLDAPLGSSAFRRTAWELAQQLVDCVDSPAEWNQALMELGARCCTPRRPDCDACPLSAGCDARASGRVDELPVPKPRRAVVPVELEVLVVADGERILFERRPDGGRMAGLFEHPTREVGHEGAPLSGLFPDAWAQASAGIELAANNELGVVRHSITHHRIRARVFAGHVVAGAVVDDLRLAEERFSWLAPDRSSQAALTGMARKVQRVLGGSSGNLVGPR